MDKIKWINIAKALSIVSVVIAHISGNNLILCRIFFSFNVASFFMLSGMTFLGVRNCDQIINMKDDFWNFIKRKIGTLIIPYVIWGVISIIIYSFLGNYIVSSLGRTEHNFGIYKNLLGLLFANSEDGFFEWNRPLWFLPCLFIVEILFYIVFMFLRKIKCKSKKKHMIAMCCIMIISFVWMILYSHYLKGVYFPFEIETAFSAMLYFALGITLKELINRKDSGKDKIIMMIFAILFIIIGLLVAFKNGGVDFRMDVYGNPFLFVIPSILIPISLILLSRIIDDNKIMNYIGERTLPILVMHKFSIMFFQTILPYTREGLKGGNVIYILVCCILCIVMCLLAEFILKKVIPWIYGIRL